MANTSSAKKKVRVIERKTISREMYRNKIKTYINNEINNDIKYLNIIKNLEKNKNSNNNLSNNNFTEKILKLGRKVESYEKLVWAMKSYDWSM